MAEIKKLIESLDYEGLRRRLSADPALANKGIAFDEKNPAEAHPLHRICDGVFCGLYSDEQATEMARIFSITERMSMASTLCQKKIRP